VLSTSCTHSNSGLDLHDAEIQQHSAAPEVTSAEAGRADDTQPQGSSETVTDPPRQYPAITSFDNLRAAAEQVVPRWGLGEAALYLHLPEAVAGTCSRIRLQIGDVTLPAPCTQQLRWHPTSGGQLLAVTGWGTLKSLVQGADWLHCTALHLSVDQGANIPEGQEQQEHVRLQAELVLRVSWPLAPLGLQVCMKHAVLFVVQFMCDCGLCV
jgi:hypothetical protein